MDSFIQFHVRKHIQDRQSIHLLHLCIYRMNQSQNVDYSVYLMLILFNMKRL